MSEIDKIGAFLVTQGLLTQQALEIALEEQHRSGKSLGRVLLDKNLVTEATLIQALAAQIGMEFVDLADYSVDNSAVTLISDALARRYQALPIGWDNGQLVVAMADPGNVFAIDDIRTISRAEVKTVMATRQSILDAIDKYNRMDAEAEDISAEAASEFGEE